MLKEYFVEVSLPCYPAKGRDFRVFSKWHKDSLSPDLTHLYRVKAYSKGDAVAQILAGKAFTMISPNAKQLQFA